MFQDHLDVVSGRTDDAVTGNDEAIAEVDRFNTHAQDPDVYAAANEHDSLDIQCPKKAVELCPDERGNAVQSHTDEVLRLWTQLEYRLGLRRAEKQPRSVLMRGLARIGQFRGEPSPSSRNRPCNAPHERRQTERHGSSASRGTSCTAAAIAPSGLPGGPSDEEAWRSPTVTRFSSMARSAVVAGSTRSSSSIAIIYLGQWMVIKRCA